jgi:hypothetical protein
VSVLEFIEHLVSALAWPAAAVALCLVFRKQIKGAIDRIKSAKGFGIQAELVTGEVNRGIAQAGGALANEDRPEEWEDEAPGTVRPKLAEADSTVDREDGIKVLIREANRRQDIEALIQQGAIWGWTQAKAGIFSGRPLPVIEWTEDGRPFIAYGTTDPSAAVQPRATR